MPRKPKATPLALEIVQRLKTMLRNADCRDDLSLVHRIPVISPVGGVPLVFTVNIRSGRDGRYLATCRELPRLFVAGASEHEVLIYAELDIRLMLKAGPP